jgi:tRNA nucleotidyltransferase (CCA-adding enzyme)
MELKPNIKIEPYKSAHKILNLLQKAGFEAYWVGGTVRDLITGRQTDNADIATNALPDEVERILSDNGISVKPVGKKFGTILVIYKGQVIEVTTFRAEGRYSDKRHPDKVTFIKDALVDSQRRDFTINALYFNPTTAELLDPTGGQKDLKAKLIRFVGNPKDRIDEDSLRMLRAVRFATQLNFKIEKNSFAAIKTRSKFINRVSGERIKQELDKILLSQNKVKGLRLLDETGLLRFLVPEMVELKKVLHKSKKYHLEKDAFEHTLMVVSHLDDLESIYAGIFHDTGKIKTAHKKFSNGEWVMGFKGHQVVSKTFFEKFAERLKFPRKFRSRISWLIIHHDDRTGFLEARLIKQIKYAQEPGFQQLLDLWKADSLGNLRLQDDGSLKPRTSPAYILGLEIYNRLKTQSKFIARFAKGDLIMKITGSKPGPQVKNLILKVTEQIYLNKIKSETDLKNFLEKKNP